MRGPGLGWATYIGLGYLHCRRSSTTAAHGERAAGTRFLLPPLPSAHRHSHIECVAAMHRRRAAGDIGPSMVLLFSGPGIQVSSGCSIAVAPTIVQITLTGALALTLGAWLIGLRSGPALWRYPPSRAPEHMWALVFSDSPGCVAACFSAGACGLTVFLGYCTSLRCSSLAAAREAGLQSTAQCSAQRSG